MRPVSLAALVLALLQVEAKALVRRQDPTTAASISNLAGASVPLSSWSGVPSGTSSTPPSQDNSSTISPTFSSSANATSTASNSSSATSYSASSATSTPLPSSSPLPSASASGEDASPAPSSSTWSEAPAEPAHTGITGPGVAFNFTGMNLTYYYDNTMPPHKKCAAVSGGSDWSVPIVKNPSACGPSIQQLHTDNVVALNVSWLNQDNMSQRADLCGREIQIWQNGEKLQLPKLFLFEGCAACADMRRADVSVGTYIYATGDKGCERGTVGGFDVLVLDAKVPIKSDALEAATIAPLTLLLSLAAGLLAYVT